MGSEFDDERLRTQNSELRTEFMVWQQLANGIAIGSVYALISLGLTMVYGILRILHVAHAGIYALGAYVGLLCFRLFPDFWVSLFCGMAESGRRLSCPTRYLPLLHLPRIAPDRSTASSQPWKRVPHHCRSAHTDLQRANRLKDLFDRRFRLTETQILILIVTFSFW
jgi:hypothetical protein